MKRMNTPLIGFLLLVMLSACRDKEIAQHRAEYSDLCDCECLLKRQYNAEFVTHFDYDENDRLTTVVDSFLYGKYTYTYHWNGDNALDSVVLFGGKIASLSRDERGYKLFRRYDLMGYPGDQVLMSMSGEGYDTLWDPQSLSSRKVIRYENGNIIEWDYQSKQFGGSYESNVVTEARFDGRKNAFCSLVPLSTPYPNQSNIVWERQWGDTTTYSYEYNNKGYPVSRTSGSGRVVYFDYVCR